MNLSCKTSESGHCFGWCFELSLSFFQLQSKQIEVSNLKRPECVVHQLNQRLVEILTVGAAGMLCIKAKILSSKSKFRYSLYARRCIVVQLA